MPTEGTLARDTFLRRKKPIVKVAEKMMKLTALLLVLVALVVNHVNGYYVRSPERMVRSDTMYGRPYMNGGSDSYRHPADMDWGNFSPNPAYRTNGHRYYLNGATGYYNDRYQTTGAPMYYNGYNGYYNNYYGNGYGSNYDYRPSYYYRNNYNNYNRGGYSPYYYNGYDNYGYGRRRYSDMDWGAFSPGYRRGRYY